jgi:heme oxygenase
VRFPVETSPEGKWDVHAMDHLADVKKFAKGSVNEAALTKLAKTYALVMSKADTRYVACSDATELSRVRDNFLKKKLGLTAADAELDGAVKAICEHMKADRTKSRVTFYYLLAEHFKKLDVFTK